MTRRKKILCLCLLLLCLAAAAVWLWPRGMARLAGVEQDRIVLLSAEPGFANEHTVAARPGADPEELLEELYGFRFSRPLYGSVLRHFGDSYTVALVWEEGRADFTLLPDGTLWDGTWRYTLLGGEETRDRLLQWTARALAWTRDHPRELF